MPPLNETLRRQLLAAARSAIAGLLTGTPESASVELPPDLPGSGVFVTLRKFGSLRGCIGTFLPHGSLLETLRSIAISAARDPRFVQMPISANELKDITIEISILSPLAPIADPLALEVGVHGIYVRRGHQSGCFLPDVATERGWTAQAFLANCCEQKAGLDPNAWRSPGTEVFVFTVQKFCDS
ncbi:MAG TPA: AmmeMemoRadiSam system protein A [Phycisphaerae bacterium]|nr:AmmeMemoRadiSam system protein A [Phycisphaerae bacterium]